MSGSSHESLAREESLKPGSDRGFGFVMAAVFLLLAGLNLWSRSTAASLVWLALAAGFAALAFFAPGLLRPLNALWFRFGLVLHKVVSPLVMGVLFFAVVTPIGLMMRLFRQRPLALDLDRRSPSYWISRAQPSPGSMRKQY